MFALPTARAIAARRITPLCSLALLVPAMLILTLLGLSLPGNAQAVRTASTPPPEPSRFDIYGGYGYLHPQNSDINNYKYLPINPGSVVSVTGYFNHYLGLQAEGSFFPHGPNDCVYTAQAGPVIRYQHGRFAPFAHVLAGGAKVGGPVFQPCTWGWGTTSGIGLDYIVPAFNNRIAIRPIQADFHYSHVDYGPLVIPGGVSGGLGEIYAYRLSAGVVLRLGANPPPPPVQLGCSAQPTNVFPGEPVTVTGVSSNLAPKKKPVYTWTTTGGTLTSVEEVATITTAGLAPGDYTVTGHVSQGLRPGLQADCTGGFRVHAYEPPTLNCVANPSSLLPGQSSTITSTGRSPQNRTLSYSYAATAGTITGSGAIATLQTAGAPAGPITITCNVVDDLGKTATATTSVGITVPVPPPVPQTVNLCSISFERDRKRPVRVDNEAKGCLDEVALSLNRDASSRLVVVGRHGISEQPSAAAERALNISQYLIVEKGIDASRIELRTGDDQVRGADNVLVPAGATFNPGITTTFDPGTVKRSGQAYGLPGVPTTTRKRGKKIR